MIENMVWSVTRAGRGLGIDLARRQPSHIHLPRRRRLVRPDDQSNGAAPRGAHLRDDEQNNTAAPRGAYLADDEQREPTQSTPEEV